MPHPGILQQDPAQIRVPLEADADQIPGLALVPGRGGPELRHRGQAGARPRQPDLQRELVAVTVAVQMIGHAQIALAHAVAGLRLAIDAVTQNRHRLALAILVVSVPVDSRQAHQLITGQFRCVAQDRGHLGDLLRSDLGISLDALVVESQDSLAAAFDQQLMDGGLFHIRDLTSGRESSERNC